MTDDQREALTALSEALDPDHQGDCWPDPVAWDGRPFDEQAHDLLVLADANPSPGVDEAAEAVRRLEGEEVIA